MLLTNLACVLLACVLSVDTNFCGWEIIAMEKLAWYSKVIDELNQLRFEFALNLLGCTRKVLAPYHLVTSVSLGANGEVIYLVEFLPLWFYEVRWCYDYSNVSREQYEEYFAVHTPISSFSQRRMDYSQIFMYSEVPCLIWWCLVMSNDSVRCVSRNNSF